MKLNLYNMSDQNDPDSPVFIEGGQMYMRYDAILMEPENGRTVTRFFWRGKVMFNLYTEADLMKAPFELKGVEGRMGITFGAV